MSAIIVTALFSAEDHAFLDGLRRAHYPADRNRVPAHLTLFHHLPPGVLPELKQRLTAATRVVQAPRAVLADLMSLGEGTAFRVASEGLEALRAELAAAFAPLLMPQDRAGWRPHVTIQNKVTPAEARRLKDLLSANFTPRPLVIAGLATWRYLDGPWQVGSRHMFAGVKARRHDA